MIKANSKLPAFSIMETIVAMAIMAIVMGLIFVIFSILSERLLDYKNQNQFVSDMNRLTYSINKDIFESKKMEDSERGIMFKSYSGTTVTYNFTEEMILRNSPVFTDTFHIKVNRYKLEPISNESKGLFFRKLAIQAVVNDKALDLKFYQRIYSDELLQTFTHEH